MNRAIAALGAALVIQCGLLAFSYWPANALKESAVQTPAGNTFLSFTPGDIDRITVQDEFDNEATLTKTGERWILPGLNNLPADNARIDALLIELSDNSQTWPIARSPSAHERFQVMDDRYQRRLVLASGGHPVATVYLGTSPGFRQVHARNASQDAVFTLELNNFEIPAVSGNWLDPRLLQVRVPTGINADLYSLRLQDGHWLAGSGEEPDATELEILLATLKGLTISGIANEEKSKELASREADLVMAVESLAGTVTFELVSLDDGYFIRSDEFPFFFELSSENFARLAEVDIDLISGTQGP